MNGYYDISIEIVQKVLLSTMRQDLIAIVIPELGIVIFCKYSASLSLTVRLLNDIYDICLLLYKNNKTKERTLVAFKIVFYFSGYW